MAKFRFTLWKQINQIEKLIFNSARIPFSDIRLINENKLMELIKAVRDDLPIQLAEAAHLMRQREIFIAQVQFQGKALIQRACQQRYQLIKTNSILREAESELSRLRERTHNQCVKLLGTTRRKVAEARQEYEIVRSYIEYKYLARYQVMEQKYNKLKCKLSENNEYFRKQCLAELEKIRNIGSHLQQDSQLELERLHDEVLLFRQKNQFQCETLIQRLRQDSDLINKEVVTYTEQTLGELEERIKEMSRLVLAGRSEILRLQGTCSLETNHHEINSQNKSTYDLIKVNTNHGKWRIGKFWKKQGKD
uniref:Uncharacterized protein n=1 Tax=Paulinella chromatophora TaxID=39717 RepID=B1X3S6_PAUCH|nr:hypothetical protein PCC_0144 [Paulinella chromatophora]ACB42595.1 hypothetical protein PCC_0144 [Paulinella chromatophora]